MFFPADNLKLILKLERMRHLLWTLLVLCLTACQPINSEEVEKKTPQSFLIGQWTAPDIDFSRIERLEIDSDQHRQYIFMLAGLGKLFEKMSIEFFEDGITKDSYLFTTQLPGEKETYKEFGEYELRANGKRLIVYDLRTNERLNIALEQLSNDTMQWRMQFCDLIKFASKDRQLKWMGEPPSFTTFLTFKKY